jgi:hypothetical protein
LPKIIAAGSYRAPSCAVETLVAAIVAAGHRP